MARVFYDQTDSLPKTEGQSRLHTYLQFGDHLGSGTATIDLNTSELVERTTFQAFGALESDYRPGRWQANREQLKFTGKEEDIEVGLQYFGARYYQPHLGRWISADPASIHQVRSDLNPYAYVGARVMNSVDPFGLWAVPPPGSTTTGIGPYGEWIASWKPGALNTAGTAFELGPNGSAGTASAYAANKAVGDIMKRLSPFGNMESFVGMAIAMGQQALGPGVHFSGEGAAVGGGQAVVGTLAQAAHDPVSRIALSVASEKLSDSAAGMTSSGDVAPTISNLATQAAIGVALGAAEAEAGGCPGCICFAPGTRVLMADGSTKPIESIVAGDVVVTADPQSNDGPRTHTVKQLFHTSTYRLFHIRFGGDEGGEILATGQHPFWTARGWVRAEELSTSDSLVDVAGQRIPIDAIAIESRDTPTFNLGVEEDHTFFVVAGRIAVLVHNTDPWDILFTHGSVKPKFEHGPHAGRSLGEVAAQARELQALPEGLELGAVRMADGRWAALNNRTLMVARMANLPQVHPVDAGDAGFNKFVKNLTADGLPGPVENATIRCK